MTTVKKELSELLSVAEEANKQFASIMTNPKINMPELDDYIDDQDEDELNDNESYLLCGHCDGIGCYYCKHTGIMQWPDHDTLSEDADREER